MSEHDEVALALRELKTEVKGCRSDVRELRGAVREMFEALLDEAVRGERLKERVDSLEAEHQLLKDRVRLLERGAEAKDSNGSGADTEPVQ